jgi:hypothetical protein
MILRIVVPLVASVGAAATLNQDLCVSPMAPSFGVLPNHSPPTAKGRMFAMRQRDPSLPGG